MKEKPILFSGPMVWALLAGTKTQTRQVCDSCWLSHGELNPLDVPPYQRNREWYYQWQSDVDDTDTFKLRPRYDVGDRLWVREAWQYHAELPAKAPGGIVYRADSGGDLQQPQIPWRPSIHMFKWATRIWLEVTGVRCERLQSISAEDAIAEGIERVTDHLGDVWWKCYDDKTCLTECPIDSYRTLWNSIYAKQGYGWDSNPWVWVYEFRVVGK